MQIKSLKFDMMELFTEQLIRGAGETANLEIRAFWETDYYVMGVILDEDTGKHIPAIWDTSGFFHLATQFAVDDLNQCVAITAHLVGCLASSDKLPDTLPAGF